MRYLDTSLVVSLLRPEPSTPTVQRWVGRNADAGLYVSDWVSVEVASALSILQRIGELDAAARARAQQTYELLTNGTMQVLPLSRSVYAAAAKWSARQELSLRAGDALHLAVAAAADLELVTRDMDQARAGRTVGLAVKEVARA